MEALLPTIKARVGPKIRSSIPSDEPTEEGYLAEDEGLVEENSIETERAEGKRTEV